jgi:hypothetical protein
MTFRTYVDDVWFPHHVLEPSTRPSYRYNLDRHILPTFGPMRMSSILPVHVRQWVTARAGAGVSPATIRHNKIVLSAVFTTALNDFVISTPAGSSGRLPAGSSRLTTAPSSSPLSCRVAAGSSALPPT